MRESDLLIVIKIIQGEVYRNERVWFINRDQNYSGRGIQKWESPIY